jgi:hypothetical protein
MAEYTNKDVHFLSDPILVEIVRGNLRELDSVVEIGAHRSMLFLAMSVVEGILSELIEQENLTRLKGLSQWPMNRKGTAKKSKSELSVKDRLAILAAIGRLPPDFEKMYDRLWDYRNQVHLEAALRQQTPISRSVAQLSLAALNALIESNQPHRRFAGADWQVKRGIVQYVRKTDEFRIAIPPDGYPAVLTTGQWQNSDVTIEVIVHTPPGVLFGALYNFESLDRFRVIRLDKRPGVGDDGLFSCDAWPYWRPLYRFLKRPDATKRSHHFKIELSQSKELRVWVDDDELQATQGNGTPARWEYEPNKSVGFWIEQGACNFERLRVK